MEKAAEVYTRLKSRVLGPKLEAIQKANKAGSEKDKGDAEKGQEKLAGGETRNEKGEEETNAGNVGAGSWKGPVAFLVPFAGLIPAPCGSPCGGPAWWLLELVGCGGRRRGSQHGSQLEELPLEVQVCNGGRCAGPQLPGGPLNSIFHVGQALGSLGASFCLGFNTIGS